MRARSEDRTSSNLRSNSKQHQSEAKTSNAGQVKGSDAQNISDADIINKVLSGDVDSFEVIVTRYERKVYGLAYRMLRNADDANDAAQETFLKIYRSLASFRGTAKFSTWAYRITTNVCLDLLRKRSKTDTVSLDEPLQLDDGDVTRQVVAESHDPDEHLHKKELMSALSEAINELPEDQRQAVILRDVQGLSYAEISDVLALPLGTVKSRINRGRRTIQELMQKHKELLPYAMRLTK